jgi:hypothetical protein
LAVKCLVVLCLCKAINLGEHIHPSKSLGALVYQPPTEISKGDFLRFLVESEVVSWVTTDARSFEWDEINLDKPRFINQLGSLRFRKAFVGIFNSSIKQMEYFAFVVQQATDDR